MKQFCRLFKRTQKGGVGKSAIARLLAVEYAKSGWLVKIADLDKGQGTSTNWKARRDQNGIKPEIPVEKYASVERAINDAKQYDLMIIDGPAFAEKGGVVMAQASDLIIMPTSYSIDDLQPQIEACFDLEALGIAGSKIVFVFCRSQGSENEDKDARTYLKKSGVNVVEPIFPERISIRQAHNRGQCASEVTHKSINEKALTLAQCIADLVKEKD